MDTAEEVSGRIIWRRTVKGAAGSVMVRNSFYHCDILLAQWSLLSIFLSPCHHPVRPLSSSPSLSASSEVHNKGSCHHRHHHHITTTATKIIITISPPSSPSSSLTIIDHHAGADQGFFLEWGAVVSCSTSTTINHIVFFLHNTSCIRKPQVISGRGGGGRTHCTLPKIRPCHDHKHQHLYHHPYNNDHRYMAIIIIIIILKSVDA